MKARVNVVKRIKYYITAKEKREIVNYCLEHDMKLCDMASELGLTKSSFSHIINGVQNATYKFVFQLKEKFGIELKYGND